MSALDIPKLPPDALELLNDPQLADLRSRGPGMPKAGKTLRPAQPPKSGESPFVLFKTDFEYVRAERVAWSNAPTPRGSLGEGNGFPTLKNAKPHFTVDQPKPDTSLGAWNYSTWLMASPQFVATIRQFDPAAIEMVDIDWIYADGRKLDGYVFLDVTRLLYAYDYRRSVVNVEIDDSGKYIASVSAPRALKRDLPAGVHVFRESYWRHEIFFSRELAKALLKVEPYGYYFEDLATGGYAKF